VLGPAGHGAELGTFETRSSDTVKCLFETVCVIAVRVSSKKERHCFSISSVVGEESNPKYEHVDVANESNAPHDSFTRSRDDSYGGAQTTEALLNDI
jgi:hypothetical protein